MEEGILLAKEMELHQIVVESDSVVVFEAINANNCNGTLDWSYKEPWSCYDILGAGK